MICDAIIVAAGVGKRAGCAVPKQFERIAGKALVAHAYDAFADHPAIRRIIIVTGADQHEALTEALAGRTPYAVVDGGAERQASVRNGLAACDGDAVLIHDAARPLVPAGAIHRLISALDDADGAVPVLPVADTLVRDNGDLGETVPRDGLVRVQTPQAFRLAAITRAHATFDQAAATDDAQLVRALGLTVATVAGDPMLDKITFPGDFARMEAMMTENMIVRTGQGYDVHRLEAGLPLWLCGVQIVHDKGLLGHSDADVGLHAIVDAILGALGQGDIGDHFPPSDPQWRGAASSRFVEYARSLADKARARIDHVDVTLICEAPKIGPHRAAMRAQIAALLGVSLDSVNVKATTTERLGFTGRGEGIAAQAIATISMPRAG
jgi:2-C-methyl-D-erythritol 4-phosphate cytidylyltransferase / 2-C-methyl-D-erythritol 2,4-cyclodiphosphate synthase